MIAYPLLLQLHTISWAFSLLTVILESCTWFDIHKGVTKAVFFQYSTDFGHHRSPAQCVSKAEKQQIYREFRNCLDVLDPVDGKPADEVVGF